MKRRELCAIFFIIFVNSVYFFIVFSIYSFLIEGNWAFYGNPLAWLAEWIDFKIILRRSATLRMSLIEFPILGGLYLYAVGQAACITGSMMASYIPCLTPFHYHVLYMGLSNVLFEIITVILTMRLVSRYFGKIFASNIMFIFILLPLVLWVTICKWDMLPIALTICIIYFAVENKPWYSWISLTIATLTKIYPILFGIPLIFYYFERDGFKKTFIYVLSMITLGVLIYIPFFLIYGLDSFSGIFFQSGRAVSRYSIWYWIFLLFGETEKKLLYTISVYIQVGLIFTYVLLDYFSERKKKNPLSVDKALLKRCSIVILLFLLTFKLGGGNQYVVYAFPLLLTFINCFKKLIYFMFWIITLHTEAYLRIIIYAYLRYEVIPTVFFPMTAVFFSLYMVAIVLILSNKNLYENTIAILNERDFMLELYNFAKKIKFL